MNLRLLVPALLVSLSLTGAPPEPVALVYTVGGSGAKVVMPGTSQPSPLALFTWLREGASVLAPPDGHLLLSFRSGKRFELRANASATLGADQLMKTRGEVRGLPSVPPFPKVAPIAADERSRPAAIRIREGSLSPLSPDAPRRVLAGNAALAWPTVPGAARYRISIEAEDGRIAFQAEPASSPLKLPGDVLSPGARYYWHVSAVPLSGFAVKGDAVLLVLAADAAESRRTLRASLLSEGDPEALALMAEVDRSLGLDPEAVESAVPHEGAGGR